MDIEESEDCLDYLIFCIDISLSFSLSSPLPIRFLLNCDTKSNYRRSLVDISANQIKSNHISSKHNNVRCTKLKAATTTTRIIITTTTTRNNNANSGNMKFSMKSDKKSRFLNYNERKADLSVLFLSSLLPVPGASSHQLFLPKMKPQRRMKDIRNTKYKTHNWLTQK